jgi:filamentous hemagglutinin family protein
VKRASARSLALAGLAGGLLAGVVCAQTSIKTDSSWGRTPAALSGSPSATPVVGNRGATYRVSGNVYTIAEALGRLKGTNLFHSFESFSVGAGDAAVFTTATPTINNVVSRVSGSTATQINGLLALKPENGGAPNFFFINPAGVTFGAGALVDVPAAFHISTANRLSFADGTMFKAGDGSDSSLTVAAPEAFGFLGTTRSSLYVMEGATLSPAAGHELSAFAGDVRIHAGQLATAGGGAIRIAAVGQDQLDVPLAGPLPSAHGNLDVVNGGNVVARSVPLENGAGISVSAGDVLIDGHASGATFTGIATVPSQDGAASAGSIHLAAAGYLRVFDGGVIESQSYGDGSPGEIVVRAQNLTLDSRGNWDAVDSQGVPVPTGIVTWIPATC